MTLKSPLFSINRSISSGVTQLMSPGIDIFNPVFDRVPPGLLAGMITEKGIIEAAGTAGFIREHLGGI